MTIDRDTQDWIRTPADDRAARSGMRFDGERAAFVCDWIEGYCCLYEGDLAGQPIRLYPAQREFVSRLFGWVRWSDEWDKWVRRFTHAAFWGAKKNGKSPLCAAVNLYLTCGDGEPGQKVYQAAKNGDQARIAQRHAFNMVKQSPALAADCKLHGSTLDIKHLPTESLLTVLTGDDTRGAQSKEGLNGSVAFDEMHVVNREMYERVSRAGISRREPLVLSYSTAGDDPASVGHERCEYGRQVNAGDRDDLHFLHVEYAAPAKVSDADIDDRLEELGRAANPAWGVIVKPSEFRSDWERSKGKPREAARFRQYRLNQWVGSTNQWLDTRGWDKGQRKYDLPSLAGRECFLGIDLSRTRDMTAAPFVFPWPESGAEAVRLWPQFWLPESRAAELDHLFPYRNWSAAGDLRLTPGTVVDYAIVEDDIVTAVEEHGLIVRGIYFDQTYAEELTQRLADRLGCPRVNVPQSWRVLSPLAKEFERRVSVGLVEHPGNAVMTWQVGHCEVRDDRNMNIVPVKPAANSGKSIDGVAATVNTFAGVASAPDTINVYDTREPLVI